MAVSAVAQQRGGRVRFAINVGARVVQLFTGFASILLLVRVLPPADLGTFYISTAVGITIALVPLNFLHFPIQRLMPGGGPQRDDFLASLVRWPAILTVALWMAYAAFFATAASDAAQLAILVSVYALSETIFAQGTNIASALLRPASYFLAVTARSVVILGSLVVLSMSGGTATGAMAIYALGALVPFYLFVPEMRKALWTGRVRKAVFQGMLAFGWPYMISQSFRQVVERGDRVLVGIFLGPVIAGQYSVAVDLARRVIQGVTVNARFTFVREAIEAYDAGDTVRTDRALRSIAGAIAIAGLPVASGIAVFGGVLIAPLLGDRFDASALAILPIAAFVFVIEAYRLYLFGLAFELTRKAYFDAIVSCIGAVVQVVLIVIFAQTGNLEAIAYSLVLTQVVMLGASIALSRLRLDFRIPVRPALIAVLASVAFAWCGSFFLGYWDVLGWYELVGVAAVFGALHIALMVALVAAPAWRR